MAWSGCSLAGGRFTGLRAFGAPARWVPRGMHAGPATCAPTLVLPRKTRAAPPARGGPTVRAGTATRALLPAARDPTPPRLTTRADRRIFSARDRRRGA